MWKHLILPSTDLPKGHREHEAILYGVDHYPRMAGYYLVKQYVETNKRSTKELLNTSSSVIAKMTQTD